MGGMEPGPQISHSDVPLRFDGGRLDAVEVLIWRHFNLPSTDITPPSDENAPFTVGEITHCAWPGGT
jgi:hypothetical protein